MAGGKNKKEKKAAKPKKGANKEVRGVLGQKSPYETNYHPANVALAQYQQHNQSPLQDSRPNSLNLAQTYFVGPSGDRRSQLPAAVGYGPLPVGQINGGNHLTPSNSPMRPLEAVSQNSSPRNSVNSHGSSSGTPPIPQSYLHSPNNMWTPTADNHLDPSTRSPTTSDSPNDFTRTPTQSGPNMSALQNGAVALQSPDSEAQRRPLINAHMVLPNIEIPEADYDEPGADRVAVRKKVPPLPPPKTRPVSSLPTADYDGYFDFSPNGSAQEGGRDSKHNSWSSADIDAVRRPARNITGAYDRELQEKLGRKYSPALNDGEYGRGVDNEGAPKKTHMTMINAKMMAKIVSAEIDQRMKP